METATQLSLSDILRSVNHSPIGEIQSQDQANGGRVAYKAAEAEWQAATAALMEVIQAQPRLTASAIEPSTLAKDVIISGPFPIFNTSDFGQPIESWVMTPQPIAQMLHGQRSLLPSSHKLLQSLVPQAMQTLPLVLPNPFLAERFCLAVTSTFSMALVLGQPTAEAICFQYSFDPQILLQLWRNLRSHLADPGASNLDALEERIRQQITATPDYQLITQFTQRLLAHLPHRASNEAAIGTARHHSHIAHRPDGIKDGRTVPLTNSKTPSNSDKLREIAVKDEQQDTELLQAMAHEIRTPLTTIRTYTRSLLRRQDLSAEVRKRIDRIDQECTQQIDRFNLIFQAVELETTKNDRQRSPLTSTALNQIFQDAIPRWQQQAHRRNLSLDVKLPDDLPRVTSDPVLLNQVLTGVVEWFTQCLPAHSHIQMRVMLAGHQLKLQFEAEPEGAGKQKMSERPLPRSLGQLLMVTPETGGLSLNLDATKNLFHFLGGKLIVRQRPEQGEVLTVFLPLDDAREV